MADHERLVLLSGRALTLLATIAACATVGVFALPGPVASVHPPSVTQLGWLAGCWERQQGALLVQEHWLEPRGGLLLGMSRTTRGDSLVEYEFMRIFGRDSTLVFAAQPSGQRPAEFVATSAAGTDISFENAAHDFPQRVTYAAVGADSLRATIEGSSGGRARAVEFAYARTACHPGVPAK